MEQAAGILRLICFDIYPITMTSILSLTSQVMEMSFPSASRVSRMMVLILAREKKTRQKIEAYIETMSNHVLT